MHDHKPSSIYLAFGLIALLFSILACNAPIGPTEPPPLPTENGVTAPPELTEDIPTPPPEATGTPVPGVVYEDISFSYDPAVAADVLAETVPAEEASEDVPWLPVPEHIRFSFVGYPLADTFHEPQILIYPVSEYETTNQQAAGVIADLRQLLIDKPDAPSGIPFLPLWNAGQMMRTNVVYLEFQNGTGVRFVTQYSQAPIPVNNKYAFYTYQGLTQDGSYYVSAILPVSNLILPADDSEIPGGDFGTFADNYENYINDLVQQLNQQPPSSFTPDLTLLDALIQSLRVK